MFEMFKSWLATSPLASSARTAFALGAVAALDWTLQNIASFQLPVVAQVAIAAAIPPIIRALNSADGVFGRGSVLIDEQ